MEGDKGKPTKKARKLQALERKMDWGFEVSAMLIRQ